MSNNNAKYVFYYLLSLVALVFMTLSLGMIIFAIIDKSIIDVLATSSSDLNGQLRFAISALIISTPIYYFTTSLINKGLKSGELRRESGLRRCLSYFILFVSSLIVLGVLISVINSFLSGGLSARFVFKALTVFFLAAFVFSFYLYDLKRLDFLELDKKVRVFFWISLSFILIIFSASWFFMESPKVARSRRLDNQLMDNIHDLEVGINEYYNYYGNLPTNLKVLKNSPVIHLDSQILRDPASGQAIIYQKESNDNFKLCATFRLAQKISNSKSYYSYRNEYHEAGYQCLKGHLYLENRFPQVNNIFSKSASKISSSSQKLIINPNKKEKVSSSSPHKIINNRDTQASFPRPPDARPNDIYIN